MILFIRKPPDPDNDVYDFREVCEKFFSAFNFEFKLFLRFRLCGGVSDVVVVCDSSGYGYLLRFQEFLLQCLKRFSLLIYPYWLLFLHVFYNIQSLVVTPMVRLIL